MKREVYIYAGGKSGWVENLLNNASVHFVVYNDEIPSKKYDLRLGWDSLPTAIMSKEAKKAVFEYHKTKKECDWHFYTK